MNASAIPSLASCFAGNLAPYGEALRLSADDDEAVPGRDLLDAGGTERLIARYAASTYPDADRRAVASMWSQWYFGTLVVPMTAAILHDHDLPIGLAELDLIVRPDGRALGVVLPHQGTAYPRHATDRFGRLIANHVDPLVQQVAQIAGLSRRVLWANAAVMLGWTLDRVEEAGGGCGDACAECRGLLAERTDAAGRINPICSALCPIARAHNNATRRRVCCLRYRLPGMPSCGDVCPLTEAQRGSDEDLGGGEGLRAGLCRQAPSRST